MFRLALCGCLAAIGCTVEIDGDLVGADGGPDAGADADPGSPDAGAAGEPLGTFQLTYYWVSDEADYPGVPDTDVHDPDCNVLATVPADFWDSMRLEGTARVLDGRVLNYWGSCACATSPCFTEVDAEHPWGSGSMSRPLVPFRSVAIDRLVLTIGDLLYAPLLDGVVMPGDAPWGDFVHDGCLSADDTGGGIDGMHVDFFAATRDAYVTLDGVLATGTIELYAGGDRCPAR